MQNNKLIKLDFAPGLKAKDVNQNFETIKNWVDRERIRIGGHGLVEGFNMTADLEKYTITVSEGLLINPAGEEIIVPKHTFSVGAPEATRVIEPVDDYSKVVVPDDGILTLKYRPYSINNTGYIEFIPPRDTTPSEDELYIEDVQTGMRVPILEVVGRQVMVNAAVWKGHTVRVRYYTTDNRIDSILIDTKGNYEYQRSIRSTSPSHVDLDDYSDKYMIGVVYWNIGKTLTVEFYDIHRTYRKIYVDSKNQLWLNGEIYKKSKFIFFEKPEDPQVDDIWYDRGENILYIYRAMDGEFGWTPINDTSCVTIREYKMFLPGTPDWPKDNQHFRFGDEETNLWFVPGQHSLEIRIDNAIVMEDQFEEYAPVMEEDYLTNGRGFNLMDPLDSPTPVEVIVTQTVRSRPVRELFQRAAIFIDEGHEYYNPTNKTKTFKTKQEYVLGEDQLEVFVDGLRLIKDIDYLELNDHNEPATIKDQQSMSAAFRLKCDIKNGQMVAYKISKHVWSYDHLDKMISDIRSDVRVMKENIAKNALKIEQLDENVVKRVNAVNSALDSYKKLMGSPDRYMKADTVVPEKQIDSTARSKFVTGKVSKVIPSDNPVLNGVKEKDFIVVSYMTSYDPLRPLIKDVDYVVSDTETGCRIDLSESSMISVDASLYVQALLIGER